MLSINEIISIWYNRTTSSQKSNGIVSGDHDRRTQGGGRVGACQGGGSIHKKILCVGGVPLWGIFSMWTVFSLHMGTIFSVCVCVGGFFFFCMGEGALLGLPPPITIFADRASCCHIFTAQIFIIFPVRGGFNILWGSYSIHSKNLPPPPPPPPQHQLK